MVLDTVNEAPEGGENAHDTGRAFADGQSARRRACIKCQESVALFPFTMAFQPIIDIEARRIDAYEALARGPNGEGACDVLSQLTPDTLYAFDQASRVLAIEMAARHRLDRRLNINFQPNAVYSPAACIQLTLRAARRVGFPLHLLTFEIVEGEFLTEPAHLRRIIAEYQRHGFMVALDDFATGYSGLARLVELQPDIIKIDRALVQNCDRDRKRRAIVSGIIRIAADIGIKLVVEGVETRDEMAAMRDAGARYMQGFYFARPAFEAFASDAQIDFSETSRCEAAHA
jgi:EAL domain-containing protein (putative c-di-GMP-specific phosphodiesterase class I)